MKSTNKPPISFWVISGIALLWNIMGLMAYISQAYITDEALTMLPEDEQNFYKYMPVWVTAAFALAVITGTLGSIVLLLRKRWCVFLFIISLLAVITQATYNFFIQDYIALSGNRVIMPIIVILIAIFLVWFSKKSQTKLWIT